MRPIDADELVITLIAMVNNSDPGFHRIDPTDMYSINDIRLGVQQAIDRIKAAPTISIEDICDHEIKELEKKNWTTPATYDSSKKSWADDPEEFLSEMMHRHAR